ncbi:O-antigen ligase family protein [uncultured Winogradskyella sp.]|uniref:O-antigen ligase family protein n=1 Tax=uncultured Winogradskyella sp. TaxID=395353 RepID=UPI002634B6A0|nr:O-antigen ligase family protein [uncultured Winogradskyella sp.]
MKSNNKYVFLIILHAVLGVVIYLALPVSKVYFNLALLYFFVNIIISPKNKKTIAVLQACAYFVGAEVLFRMTKGGLAYEASKYLIIVFVLIGMFYKGISGKGYSYFIYLVLLVPSVILASMNLSLEANFRTNVAFVLSGPTCLGLAALFAYDRKISINALTNILMYASLPIVSMTMYLYFYNPSIEETLSGTSSNFAASGGFGPNQVSTILGLGMIVFTVRLLLHSPTLFLKVLNMSLLALISFRAVVTFSRGGVFTAIIVIAAFVVLLYNKSSRKQRNQLAISFFLFLTSIIVTWMISSAMTMGLIDKRYANEDALGRGKDDITTGRVELFMDEIEGFIQSPFLGIGASRVKDRRLGMGGKGVVSHNEISRLLSEHGLIGIIILLILIFTPLSYRSRNKNNIFFYAFLAFWFATINHSAMRIAAPAFLYSLSLLNVKYEKRPLHRKRLIK